MSSESEEQPHEAGSWKLSAAICAVIIAAAGSLAFVTFNTEPTAQKEGATKKTPMLVDVLEVTTGKHRPHIQATGVVRAAVDVQLQPQVSGRVVEISEAFVPGGFVKKGELLVRLENADFRNTLAQRQSALEEIEAELAIEKGRQDLARSEYKYLDKELAPEKKKLLLREPQLESLQGRIKGARANVAQARLDLKRTTIEAPFDAHILQRTANVGSQLGPSTSVGRLVGLDAYWVAIDVPLSKLRWITLPNLERGEQGATVHIRNPRVWEKDQSREAHLVSLVGSLDSDTRMARILAEVKDPMARGEALKDQPPLILGEFVEVSIQGREVDHAVKLSRDYLRDRDTVWVMAEDKLSVREVEVAFQDADFAYITAGLKDGDKVVTTNISTPVDGEPLRLKPKKQEAAMNTTGGER